MQLANQIGTCDFNQLLNTWVCIISQIVSGWFMVVKSDVESMSFWIWKDIFKHLNYDRNNFWEWKCHFLPSDHCMVNFIKENLLGSVKEFRNRFINPIQNGQCADSTLADVRVMKKRAHILYEMLAGCVQVSQITTANDGLNVVLLFISCKMILHNTCL